MRNYSPMADNSTLYKMAFSFLKRMNASVLCQIAEKGVTPEEFFLLPTKELLLKTGLALNRDYDRAARDEALGLARVELKNIEAHHISPLFLLDEDYPRLLAETFEPPIILYKLGEADLNGPHNTAIVGTRKPTSYGVDFCNRIVEDISRYFPDALIVSGLAYGVDATAHRKALETDLTTVAVLAHGLNMIYPASHRNLAKEILRKGGALLSEYPFNTKPFKPRFLARNRIVAGIADVTIVVESNIKGGAMSTANYAFLYNRELMALPGRFGDDQSSGCNHLIRKNKARLLENISDIVNATGWIPEGKGIEKPEANIFLPPEGEALQLYNLLKYENQPVVVDSLVTRLGISASRLLALIGELEFDGLVMRHPGNRVSLA